MDEEPEIDGPTEEVVELFTDISQWRTIGMNGPNPISLQDLHYYSLYFGAVLCSFQLQLMRELDSIYLKAYYDARRTE